jgi:Extensin-like protein C-terminus
MPQIGRMVRAQLGVFGRARLALAGLAAALAAPATSRAEPTTLASYLEPLPAPIVSKRSAASRWASLSGQQCLSELGRRKLAVKRWRGAALGVNTPVRVTGPLGGVRYVTPGAKSPYGILDCRLAVTLADLGQLLRQHGVAEVRVDNMYRPKAHLPGKKKPSQHAYGLAIDLTRLKLDDGTELIVERDFQGAIGEPVCGKDARVGLGKEAGKLRDVICDVARAELFHHILTPNHDAAHRDHFHLDIARGARQRIIE